MTPIWWPPHRKATNGPLRGSSSGIRHQLWPYVCALSGGEVDEAQDLLQETFVRAWSRLGELQSGAAFHAWLRTLAYRLALDRCDKQQHRDQLLARYAMVAEGERTPEQRLLSRELGAAIAEAAQSLSESSRRIFTALSHRGQIHYGDLRGDGAFGGGGEGPTLSRAQKIEKGVGEHGTRDDDANGNTRDA